MPTSAATGAGLLHVENLDVSSDGHALLRGVGFSLERGGRLGMVGPSGCGKTTLLRAVAGLIDPDSGSVTFEGRTPEAIGWPQFRRRVLLVAQQPTLLDETVGANLMRPFSYGSAEGAFPHDRAKALMARLGLSADRFDQPARSLSVGQQQRVCLVRALLLEPAVLLLDEPTSALDPESVDAVGEALSERDEGLAILMVLHRRDLLERWCERSIDLAGYLVNPSEFEQ